MKSNFSTPGFLWPLLTLICVIIVLCGLNKVLQKTNWSRLKGLNIFWGTGIAIVAWTVLLTVLSYKGFFADFGILPPRAILAVLVPLPIVMLAAFSKTGTVLLQRVPAQWLLFMQAFRIFVEILIWFAFLAGKLPIQMSFEGGNLDILTGLLALPAGFLFLKNKSYSSRIILIFNTAGILLLLNILTIAMLSMPSSIQYFMNEPSSALVAQFPFILLPGVLVPMAYSFHIFSLRQLWIKKSNQLITTQS